MSSDYCIKEKLHPFYRGVAWIWENFSTKKLPWFDAFYITEIFYRNTLSGDNCTIEKLPWFESSPKVDLSLDSYSKEK